MCRERVQRNKNKKEDTLAGCVPQRRGFETEEREGEVGTTMFRQAGGERRTSVFAIRLAFFLFFPFFLFFSFSR